MITKSNQVVYCIPRAAVVAGYSLLVSPSRSIKSVLTGGYIRVYIL